MTLLFSKKNNSPNFSKDRLKNWTISILPLIVTWHLISYLNISVLLLMRSILSSISDTPDTPDNPDLPDFCLRDPGFRFRTILRLGASCDVTTSITSSFGSGNNRANSLTPCKLATRFGAPCTTAIVCVHALGFRNSRANSLCSSTRLLLRVVDTSVHASPSRVSVTNFLSRWLRKFRLV